MKTSTTIVLVAAAFALSFASIAIVTPKAVKAAIATLIRDQDQAARRPFTTSCSATGSSNGTVCITPNIPAGEEVVIETVEFEGLADPTNTRLRRILAATTSGVAHFYLLDSLADDGASQPSISRFAAIQPVRLYADPGTAMSCEGDTHAANPVNGLFVGCIISGYSVSLP
jgi:hypothetical protein